MMCEKQNIIDSLKTVYDPEIPVNVWDMGLIYDIDISPDVLILATQNTVELLKKNIIVV